MALQLTRLAVQRQLVGCYFRGLNYPSTRLVTIKAIPAGPPSKVSFDEKNAGLKRPLSPHLTIYKFPFPVLLSGTHRATGMVLGIYISAFGIGSLSLDYPAVIEAIHNLHLPGALIFSAKSVVAFPFAYHFVNGLRHLLWDTGKLLKMKEVYLTGYITLLVSSLLTAWLVSL